MTFVARSISIRSLALAGLALILIQFLPFRSGDPIMLGVILVFVAAGLLTYYATARRMGRPTARGGAA